MAKKKYSLGLWLRIVGGAVVFLLFHIALVSSRPWAELLLRNLARLQFLPAFFAVLGSSIGWLAMGFLPVLVLTMLVGRLYCSILCPLGITQDIIIFLGGKLRRAGFRQSSLVRTRARLLHLGIAGIAVALFFSGFTLLINILEPYAFWGRLERDLVMPLVAGGSYLSSEVLKSFGFFFAPITFFGHLPVVLVTAFLFLLLLLVTSLKGRWFCNSLCPTGAVLRLPAMVPGLPLFKIRVDEGSCTRCGLCERVCKTGSIAVDKDGVCVDAESCVVCFVCISRCPYSAMRFSASSGEHDGGRRRFLGKMGRIVGKTVGAGSLFSLILPGTYAGLFRLRGTGPEGNPNRPASPPGSKGIDRFHAHCISCHTCVAACPTHVLQPSLFEYGLSGFMQPVMDYGTGYCEWECVSCLNVCPVGAILPLGIEEKQKTQIGRVQFIQDRCVIFSKGTACGACAEVCPTGAVWMVPYRPGLTQPETDNKICVGCGNCEYACPVEGGKAIFVRGNITHTEREIREEEEEGPKEAEPEEFPF